MNRRVDRSEAGRVDRRVDRSEAGGVDPRLLDDILAKAIMGLVTLSFGRFGRLEPHVVPAEILERGAALPETLRAHGRTGSALAGEQSRGERGERLGFCHG